MAKVLVTITSPLGNHRYDEFVASFKAWALYNEFYDEFYVEVPDSPEPWWVAEDIRITLEDSPYFVVKELLE